MSRRQSCVICNVSVADSMRGTDGHRICPRCDVSWCLAEDPVDPAHEWDMDYYGRRDIIELHELRRSGMVAIVSRISAICPNRGQLLDVGTGVGIFMQVAAESGWSVEGVEPSKIAADRARDLTRARVYNGLLEEVDLPQSHYDVISIVDILRSVPNPISFLRCARRLLRPGGILLIRESDRRMEGAFRNMRALLRRRRRSTVQPTSRRASSFAQLFSPKSLLYAFNQVGLEGWIEPSPVFIESKLGPHSASSLAKRVVGLTSATLYKMTGGRVIFSPNLLAFGRNVDG